ncbi:hypothetical protein F5883DRAFT_41443 [Diaporthe sp. PMI_573]|nr:hypothetical protein F5883DRAFT_41443 [Diaporthaceae sp. PMI_573]
MTAVLPLRPEDPERLISLSYEDLRMLEAETPLDNRPINTALQVLAGIAPCTVMVINSLGDSAIVPKNTWTPHLNRKTNPEPITLIPIQMTHPEPSWLLGALDSAGMRLLDPMPAKDRTQVFKKMLETLFGNQHVVQQPITEVNFVQRATGADTGISILINAIQAILTSCAVEKSLPSTVAEPGRPQRQRQGATEPLGSCDAISTAADPGQDDVGAVYQCGGPRGAEEGRGRRGTDRALRTHPDRPTDGGRPGQAQLAIHP